MSTIAIRRSISAPPEAVFDAVAHIDRFAEVVPDIVDIEFLGEERRGVGTRFRETRIMNGREATTELEVTEYEPHHRVRLVSDAGGTVWDTIFRVSPQGEGTRLEMTMEARPHRFLARIVTPLMKGMVRKAIEKDMDALKAFCEEHPVEETHG